MVRRVSDSEKEVSRFWDETVERESLGGMPRNRRVGEEFTHNGAASLLETVHIVLLEGYPSDRRKSSNVARVRRGS